MEDVLINFGIVVALNIALIHLYGTYCFNKGLNYGLGKGIKESTKALLNIFIERQLIKIDEEGNIQRVDDSGELGGIVISIQETKTASNALK